MKTIGIILLFFGFSNLSFSQEKDVFINQYSLPAAYRVSTFKSKTILDLQTDRYTTFVQAFNQLPNDSFGYKNDLGLDYPTTELLKPMGFLRSHQSHLVNGSYIRSWIKEDGGTLLLTNGDRIPVSKPNKGLLQASLNRIR